MSSQPIVLHTTPPLAPLPASDAESLYYAGILQLAAPDKWAVTQGDWGVNGGSLPYITHLDHLIKLSHLSSLPGYQDLDKLLSQEEQVDALCWKAYLEQNLTDLVNHALYSLPPNYSQVVAKAQLADLSFPQTQYIPQRIRSTIRSRLQHVGLWGLGGLNAGDAAEEDRKRLDEQYVVGPAGTLAPRAWSGWTAGKDAEDRRKRWGEQELQKKIRSVLDPLVRRLGDRSYCFGDRPTTLDVALFAQLTLVLSPTLPNPLFANLLHSSYPTLAAHHDRLLSVLFPSNSWTSIRRIPRSNLVHAEPSYVESISSWWKGESSKVNLGRTGTEEKSKSKKDKAFERGRWLWFAGATLTMITYLFASGMVQIDFGGAEELSEDDEVDESGDDDELEETEEEEEVEIVEAVEDGDED